MTENGSYIMTNYSANHFSPLSRSQTHPNLPQGKGQVTPVSELQPPLVLPRRGEAGYSGLSNTGDAGYSDLSKTGEYRLLRFVKDWETPTFPFCKFTFFLATIEKNYVT